MVRRGVLLVLVVGSLALLTISFRSPTSGALHDVQGYGASALRPFQVAAERVARPFRDAYGYFDGLAHARSENKKLRREVRQWRAQATQFQAQAGRAQDLERLLRVEGGSRYPSDFRFVNTSVISFPLGAFVQQITIAAGSNSGLRVNTPIIDQDGLLGHVVVVGPSTASVQLITDADSNVPARDIANGVRGLIRHGAGSTLLLDQVSKEQNVEKGDVIVTQGTVDRRYPDLYPYGIPVGRVLTVGRSDIASYLTVQVLPFARFDSLDTVAALISTKKR
jgi:rod shape-determining protein MreC